MKFSPALYASPINLPERTSGRFAISHRELKDECIVIGQRQALLRGLRPVKALLSEPRRVHELREDGSIWMTDLPEELNQIAEVLATVKPKDDVLVGGLGLGILWRALEQHRAVNTITVVEKSKDVITLCGAAAPTPRSKIVCDDIFHFIKTHPYVFHYYLLDTWTGTSEMEYWRSVFPLRRLIRNKHGSMPRIHCWAEDIMCGQVKRMLMQPHRHWYYEKLPPSMSAREADWFLRNVGSEAWEAKYGKLIVSKL